MNQVQEMPKLADLARLPEALERLRGLFEVMRQQPGFLSVELLQGVTSPATLLVLHAWRDLADWEAFSRSQWKAAFMDGRPAGLYEMQRCGLNWRSAQADGARAGGLLRREVLRDGDVPLRSGPGVLGCQTFLYRDDLPDFAGATLRLTRVADAAAGTSDPEPGAITDEIYRSLVSVPAEARSLSQTPAAS